MYNEKKESSVNDLKKKERKNVSLFFIITDEKSGVILIPVSSLASRPRILYIHTK